MSTFLNRFSNDATQRIEVDSAFAGTPIYHDGLVYGLLDVLVVNYAGTLVGYLQGIGQTAAGELMVFDASAGLPADTFWQSGLPISAAEHRLCVDPTNAVALVHDGIPFTTVGAVAVNGSPAPPAATISSIVITQGASDGPHTYFGQLYYGASGVSVDTFYSNKATFLTDNAAAALETFAGIAPPGGLAAMPAFGGFAITAASQTNVKVADDTQPGVTMPWDAFISLLDQTLTITFTPPVAAGGFNFAYPGGHVHTAQVDYFDGATLLHSEPAVIPVSPVSAATWSFSGYAIAGSAPPPAAHLLIEDGTDFLLEDGGLLLLE